MLFNLDVNNEEDVIELEDVLYQGQGRSLEENSDDDKDDDLEMLAK
eukprot:CAMPEP_0168316918 /NCGR_PEP_ID=MMETSP0210-20121227/20739_1 /TAXON_ID=40633 /ORGANISM="Condylostoma magnum, Strain COL2" /LENGTH=45 /DNA_ID= /DNA_START= /DNA_END= /DNA_ORIENTATION=